MRILINVDLAVNLVEEDEIMNISNFDDLDSYVRYLIEEKYDCGHTPATDDGLLISSDSETVLYKEQFSEIMKRIQIEQDHIRCTKKEMERKYKIKGSKQQEIIRNLGADDSTKKEVKDQS